MKIVGTGCGPGLLTVQAANVIRAATQIYGSKRALDLVKTEISPECEVRIISDYSSLKSLPEEAVILSTGDPMLSGLGYLPGTVIPGISSVQYASAKLHIPMTRTVIITAHGRERITAFRELTSQLKLGKIVSLITDPDFSIQLLCDYLKENELNPEIILCEELGYPSEIIQSGSPDNPPTSRSGMYILFLKP